MTHRDPVEVVPSFVSMEAALYKLSAEVSDREVGTFWSQRLAQWIQQHSPYKTEEAIPSPVGAAHAYDTVHLLAMAVNQAKSTDPRKVRDALERLPPYSGAVRDYRPAFTSKRHDALGEQQLLFVRLTPQGVLVPVP